jgi:hypothetical protein
MLRKEKYIALLFYIEEAFCKNPKADPYTGIG